MHSVSRTAKTLGAAVALSFAMALPAAAADINDFIVNGANQASDENREYLIDRDFVAGGPVGVVSVGDSLRGFINFNTINSLGANLGGATPNDEFTGIFQVLVTSAIPNPVVPGDLLVTFGPDPAFLATLAALGIATTGGEIAALFTDASHNFCGDFTSIALDPCNLLIDDGTAGRTVPPSSADVSSGLYASEEALGAFSTDGAFWATLGLLGLPGEGIAGNGPVSILTAFGLTSGTTAGNINAGLNLITTGPGFDPSIVINRVTPSPFGDCDPAPGIQVGSCTVDFALSQQLRGVADLDTPFEISTNTNVSFNATRVPEPSTLLLLGSALAVLGWSTRRRNQSA